MTDRERKCWEAAKKGFAEGVRNGLIVGGVVVGAFGLVVLGSQIGAIGTMSILESGGIPRKALDAAWKAGANAL